MKIFWLIWLAITGAGVAYTFFSNGSEVPVGATLLGISVLWLLIAIGMRRDMKCTWCGNSKVRKFTEVSGSSGPLRWKNANKDGSKDKRFKENYQLGTYHSKQKCSVCGAVSEYKHAEGRNPSRNNTVVNAQLVSEGEGQRKGMNY